MSTSTRQSQHATPAGGLPAIITRQGRDYESTEVQLLLSREQTLAQCREIQKRCARPPVFALGTALRLLCIEVPGDAGAEALNHAEPAVIARGDNERHARRGVRCVQWRHPMRVVDVGGVLCTDPATTWIMAARFLTLEAQTMLGDALMRRNPALRALSPAQLGDALTAFESEARAQGGRLPRRFDTCRRARALMREDTDSFPETRLRLILQCHGLPCPQVNRRIEIATGDGGTRVFFLDLSYPRLGVAVEYDGVHHRDRWEADTDRLRLLNDARWLHVSVGRRDLADAAAQREVARRVADRLSQRAGREVRLLDEPLTLRELSTRLMRHA